MQKMTKFVSALVVALFFSLPVLAFAEEAPTAPASAAADKAVTVAQVVAAQSAKEPVALYAAIAATMAIGCICAAYAVGKVGAAVMGAAAEKPEVLGKAIAFVGLGEGIALFGFLIALFLFTKI